jgi:hypothetical protein
MTALMHATAENKLDPVVLLLRKGAVIIPRDTVLALYLLFFLITSSY